MAHIVLIACASKKGAEPVAARELYQSALFKKSLMYSERLRPDAVYILSAKHGLLPANTVIAPYNESLHDKTSTEVEAWAKAVVRSLSEVADLRADDFTILAGEKYRRHLTPQLEHVTVPLEGLGIGKQLQRLDTLCRS